MTVRHATRKIHDSLTMHVTDVLTGLSWIASSGRPFGLTASVAVRTEFTGDGGEPASGKALDSPIVAVVMLGDDVDTEVEVGGSNVETLYEFAVHVFARPGVATALAEDLRDALGGRSRPPALPFHDKALSGSTLVTDETLEIEDVSMGRAQVDRPDWYLILGSVRRTHRRAW